MIMLFGDSGSAVVLENEIIDVYSQFKFAFRTNGYNFKNIITPAGAFRNRNLKPKDEVWSDNIVRHDYNTHMKGMSVFEFSITDVPKLINDFFKITDTSSIDYDYFILHQANLYILKQLSRKCKIPIEKIPISIDRYGNNSSNSIPLVLCDHFAEKKSQNIRILISGFGAGLSWGCASIEINTDNISPILVSDEYYVEEFE
jgi:3-oxoacyl-[acyl-carrier-protein] synthase-3